MLKTVGLLFASAGVIALLVAVSAAGCRRGPAALGNRQEGYQDETLRRLAGPSVAIDPAFDFYKDKSWEQWAAEIQEHGFSAVHIITVGGIPLDTQSEMVKAFHDRDMACALRLYPTTDFKAYEAHPEWRQKALDGTSRHDWRVYLCPSAPGFTEHVRDGIRETLQAVPYDAIELSEPWFEVWGGPYEKNPQHGKYACICDHCSRIFKERTGTSPGDFLFDSEKLKTDNALIYRQWQDFRVETIIEFSRQLADEAKAVRPGIRIIHMHLSDCTVEPDACREYQAQDLEAALGSLKPDILVIQDAWQDWLKPDLDPNYVRIYAEAYVKRSRAVLPDLVIKAHADIGSKKRSQRNIRWMSRFLKEARKGGFDSTVYYEYSIGDFSR